MELIRILVVEDESTAAEDIQSRLRLMGYEVQAVHAAEHALQVAGETNPDLVLMDIVLNGAMDGIEVARCLQDRYDIPVVCLTEYSDETTLERTKQAESFGYIVKPFEDRELRIAVEMALYKHKMERALSESRRQLETTLNSINDAIIAVDIDYRVTFTNPVAETMTGWNRKEAQGHFIEEIVSFRGDGPGDGGENSTRRIIAMSLEGKKPVEVFLTRKGRGDTPVACSAGPINGDHGTGAGVVVTLRDITDYRNAERKLRRSEERFRLLFNSVNDAVAVNELRVNEVEPGKFIEVNDAFCRQLGYSRKEVLTMHPGDVRQFMEVTNSDEVKRRLRVQGKVCWEARIKTKDGRYIPMELNTCRLEYEGTPLVLSVGRDITTRKEMEKMREDERKRLHALFDEFPGFIYLQNPDCSIAFANRYFHQHIGPHEGKKCHEIWWNSPRCPGDRCPAHSTFSSRTDFSAEFAYGNVPYQVYAQPFNGDRGEAQVLVWGIDISQRKKAEDEKGKLQAQLIHSEKMAGVGTLANGVAHEFNNVLQIINGYAQFSSRMVERPDVQEALGVILETSDRAAKIVKSLLSFSRPDDAEKGYWDVTELLDAVLSLVEFQMRRHNIAVIKEYRSRPVLQLNRTELQQVFLNVINNARDAMMPKGGSLTVTIESAGSNAVMRFRDSGNGIEKKNISRIFEPFYTTKGALGGSMVPGAGLGLYVAYGIIQRYRGAIDVESEIGRGTTLTITLPQDPALAAVSKPLGGEKPPVVADAPSKRSYSILVVDDEEGICQMLSNYLSEEGHKIEYAVTGDQAMGLVRRERFDIVFLDVVMPGIRGLEVLEEIKSLSPDSKVIVMTGGLMDEAILEDIKQKGAYRTIQKPFMMEEVLDNIGA